MTAANGHHTPKVLVVDDERIIADTLAAILAKSGYNTRAAYSGQTALQMAHNFQPDLMITDVAMPGMNGIEAAIKVREMFPTCKVLLFSGQATTLHLIEEARAQDHEFELLPKPVHPAELLARLRDAFPAGQPED